MNDDWTTFMLDLGIGAIIGVLLIAALFGPCLFAGRC